MGLNPISDSAIDQNFHYLEGLIRNRLQQQTVATQQPVSKQNLTFNRSWVGNGLIWLLHRLSVLPEPNKGISVSKAGIATKRKADYGIDCDSDGLLIKIKANEGLLVGADGLATKRKTNGGVLADSDGLYVNFFETTYVPDSLTLNAGTGIGTITDAQTLLDGNAYHIDEVAATPGFDIEFNFSSVVMRPKFVLLRCFYDGLLLHGININIYNYGLAVYDQFSSFSDQVNYTFILVSIPDSTNYVNSAGNMKIQLYHFSAGDITHNLDVDYIAIWAKG